MALSGSLKEFALPDIFQLIGQQRKSGRLLLSDGGREGFVIFYNGTIIDAGTSSENMISILVNYLLYHKGYPQKKITEFINYCKSNTRILCDVLIRIQYISEEELYTLAQITLEDLACSLFTWQKGNYQFVPIKRPEEYCIGNIAFSPDAITMEAMRRLDEWQRMKEVIHPGSVFVPTEKGATAINPDNSPITDPESYVLSHLDGTTSTGDLGSGTFFSTYRIYEILFLALQNGKIVQVSAEKVRAFMKQEHNRTRNAQQTSQTTVAVLIASVVFILLFLCGFLLLPKVLFAEKTVKARLIEIRQEVEQARKRTKIAAVQFAAQKGEPPQRLNELEQQGYVKNETLKTLRKANISFPEIL
ncbi:MAG: DUF4388 domain-containing protein [Chitinivibrionales bacterium]|nr:DUF4388 domain-containing protein [Chitinivibrionales bacterium]